jgi:hypothetical protein
MVWLLAWQPKHHLFPNPLSKNFYLHVRSQGGFVMSAIGHNRSVGAADST